MKPEDILLLNQLIKSMSESSRSLEKAYKQRSVEEFNKAKKNMLNLQMQIANMTT
jgi:hypothetical protein